MIYYLFSSYEVKIKDNIAMLVGEVLYFGINYLGQRLVVFKKGEGKND